MYFVFSTADRISLLPKYVIPKSMPNTFLFNILHCKYSKKIKVHQLLQNKTILSKHSPNAFQTGKYMLGHNQVSQLISQSHVISLIHKNMQTQKIIQCVQQVFNPRKHIALSILAAMITFWPLSSHCEYRSEKNELLYVLMIHCYLTLHPPRTSCGALSLMLTQQTSI